MHSSWRLRATEAVIGAAVMIALVAGVAHAKSWRKWAPDPLASDSAYATLSARPLDSLSVAESSWLVVQRDWRAQREAEAPSSSLSKTKPREHPKRAGDERFAALASRPYPALADSELTWLVAENEAQRRARESQGGVQSGAVTGIVLVAVLAAMVATLAIFASGNNY